MDFKASKQLRWFILQLKPLFGVHFISASLVVLSSLLFLLDPLLLKWLIDRVLPKKDVRLLLFSIVGFFALYVARLILAETSERANFRTQQELTSRLRLGILEHINRLSAEYFERNPIGENLYRMQQDVDQVAELGSSLVPYVLRTVFYSLFVVGAMLVLDSRLTWIVLPLAPLFFLISKYFRARLQLQSDLAQRQSSAESSFLHEHLGSILQVQLLQQEEGQTQAFSKKAAARVKTLNQRVALETLFSSCYLTILAFGTCIALGYGGYQVLVGALSIGGLVAFYYYFDRLLNPFRAVVDIYSRFNRLATSIDRILEIMETAPSVAERPNALQFASTFRGRVEMRGVFFSYSNVPVLQGLDLVLNPGEKIAIVGISGSGKSTVMKLIARLYDVANGAVCIDGIDVRDVLLRSMRTKISYLMQDAILFDRTLKENLLLGKPSATSAELKSAIEIADLEKLLERLPHGWDTPLGPRGNAVSGGERQRIALARALLQYPCLLLLDESTSALDAPSERRVFANLVGRFPHQTIVFISHRIASLSWVDRIIVLNKGGVEAQGTHDELMINCKLYSYLYSVTSFSDDGLGCSALRPLAFNADT